MQVKNIMFSCFIDLITNGPKYDHEILEQTEQNLITDIFSDDIVIFALQN